LEVWNTSGNILQTTIGRRNEMRIARRVALLLVMLIAAAFLLSGCSGTSVKVSGQSAAAETTARLLSATFSTNHAVWEWSTKCECDLQRRVAGVRSVFCSSEGAHLRAIQNHHLYRCIVKTTKGRLDCTTRRAPDKNKLMMNKLMNTVCTLAPEKRRRSDFVANAPATVKYGIAVSQSS
jgi:hypothetical protein